MRNSAERDAAWAEWSETFEPGEYPANYYAGYKRKCLPPERIFQGGWDAAMLAREEEVSVLRQKTHGLREEVLRLREALQELLSVHMRLDNGESKVFGPALQLAREALKGQP